MVKRKFDKNQTKLGIKTLDWNVLKNHISRFVIDFIEDVSLLLEIDESKALYKYVFYSLANKYEYIKSLGQGSQTNINAKIVKELEISLPSLDRQQKIIDDLDILHAFCNSLDSGLPAEINARRRQIDFYYGRLLAFKES